MSGNDNSTTSQLAAQWTNPSDVLSILLIIRGGGGYRPDRSRSDRWGFSTFVRVLGDGRLLPPPDFPTKVFNLESTYVRENKDWVLGRILRDNELFANKREQHAGSGLRISIYCATARKKGYFVRETRSMRAPGVWGMVTALQLLIAILSLALDREWGVLVVTVSGIVASLLAGALPQWRLEKIPLKKKSKKLIALTSGNGSRDIMIIYGGGVALDIEEMAAGESPRSDRVWQASKWFSTPILDETGNRDKYKNGIEKRRMKMLNGLPTGVWMTRVASFGLLIFWLALLIIVAGLKSHSWYLVMVGSVGMLQNAALAATARRPEMRGLSLSLVDTIVTQNVMDGLMDLEATIKGAGVVLRK
ncbi:hypothetical protein E8E11_011572 [Didymella keratinophila]|nr:hypothetical protein E8E11_011572 [Didymella keratinophila]